MSEPHTWRGVEFHWLAHRLAFSGLIVLAQKPYRMFFKIDSRCSDAERGSTGSAQAWCEWEGGYTRTCVMNGVDSALDGAAIALEDHLQESLNNLQKYLPKS